MKKIVWILVCVCLLVSMFGCAPSENPDQTPGTGESTDSLLQSTPSTGGETQAPTDQVTPDNNQPTETQNSDVQTPETAPVVTNPAETQPVVTQPAPTVSTQPMPTTQPTRPTPTTQPTQATQATQPTVRPTQATTAPTTQATQATQPSQPVKQYITSDEVNLRQMVVDYMYAMANIKWKAGTTIDYSKKGASSLKYESGKTYLGIAYNNNKTGLEMFASTIDSALVFNPSTTDWDKMPGNSCATSIEHAWQQVSPTVEYGWSYDMMPYFSYSGVVAIGDIDWSIYNGKHTATIIDHTPEQVVYEAYALMLPADCLVRYLDTGGHALMVTKNTIVARKPDGTIDPENSFLYLTDQNNYLNNKREYPSSWTLDRKVSFKSCREDLYLPVTIAELRDGKTLIPTASITSGLRPTTLAKNVCSGNVTANYCMNEIRVEVYRDGTLVRNVSDYPYTKTYSLGTLNDAVNLAGLGSGAFRVKVIAEFGLGTVVCGDVSFTK